MRLIILLCMLGIFVAVVKTDDPEEDVDADEFDGEDDEKQCNVMGTMYTYGTVFKHPKNKCVYCLCCKRGLYTCTRRFCRSESCGINKQTDKSSDGCCRTCCKDCKEAKCDKAKCSGQRVSVYKHNDCCETCGCDDDGVAVPQGPFGHTCENCQCKSNGDIECNRPSCPNDKLECINPTFDQDCNYICPDGPKTCRRGPVIIPGGQFVSIKFKVCTCNTEDWYTRGFCFNKEELLGARFRALQDDLCVADPQLPEIQPNPLLVV